MPRAQAAVDYAYAEARDPLRAPRIRDPEGGPKDMVWLRATEDEMREAKGAYITVMRGLWEDGYMVVCTRTWYTGEDGKTPKNVERSFRDTGQQGQETGECPFPFSGNAAICVVELASGFTY